MIKTDLRDVIIIWSILLFILILLKIYNYDIEGFETGTSGLITIKDSKISNYKVPDVKRPYVNIFDQKGRKLNVILISKPFSGDKQYETYKKHHTNNIFIGISSYLEFPNMVSNPFENFTENYKKYKYKEIVKGWIHGFRNPIEYFPPGMPTLFASESDWSDCNFVKPDPKIKTKEYDFIYICLKVDEKKKLCDDWATYNKNWKLAKKCLDIMCNKYKLKGLLIGRKDCKLPNGCHELMETTNMLKYADLRYMYQKSKFIFIPNEKDASPRVLSEALCMNVPTLINKNILGGWKYINEQTGQFFTNEQDIGKNIEIIMNGIKNKQYTPRKYFIENYGPKKSGERLKTFIYKQWGDKINIPESEVTYVTPEFKKPDYKDCSIVKL